MLRLDTSTAGIAIPVSVTNRFEATTPVPLSVTDSTIRSARSVVSSEVKMGSVGLDPLRARGTG